MSKKISIITFICLISIPFTVKADSLSDNQKLWYTYPAKYWNSQALHLGNGYFGASYFGGVDKETFSLSEKSMWTGAPAKGDWEKAGVNSLAKPSLPVIRKAVLSGNSHIADSLIATNFFGSSELFGNFTSIGDLIIEFPGNNKNWDNYSRTLDLENSLGLVEYTINKVNYKREYFCSYPDKVLGMKFTADSSGCIAFNLSINSVQDSAIVEISGNTFKLKGLINENLHPFYVTIYLKNHGGQVSHDNDHLILKNADSAELYLTIATNYVLKYPDYTGKDTEQSSVTALQKLVEQNYNEIKQRHIADYQSLYNRTSLRIEGNSSVEKLPTDQRYLKLKSGEQDPGYKVLAFNLGRYLIISSSRPHTLPANLQGVWNAFNRAPWAGNYQSNINLQEIYWSCGPTNLDECQQPYIDWIEDMAISGYEIANRVYGSDGWISHTTGNIWGHAAPIGGHPWGMYSMGSAWHCQHLWDQFAFTQDTLYLKERAYPLLKDASIFWLENLLPFNGYLITAPTVSAEHGALMTEHGLDPAFHDFESKNYQYSLPGVYQDMEMLWDLFTNTSKAAGIAGDKDFADSLINVRGKLLPLKIGKWGQLQEWYNDIDSPDCHHRHIAHLYAVCPGNQIDPINTPDLAKAAKKSLNMRGDGRFLEQEAASGGNWARAHRMWCWARLLDGNRANKILTELLTEEGFENGLTFQHATYHWERKDFYMENDLYCHFQLDASAAIPGCITEMLMQSHLDEIHLLPALPDEFKSGKITGIKARGGFTIDMEWSDHKLVWAKIYTKNNQPVPQIRLEGKIINPNKDKRIKMIGF